MDRSQRALVGWVIGTFAVQFVGLALVSLGVFAGAARWVAYLGLGSFLLGFYSFRTVVPPRDPAAGARGRRYVWRRWVLLVAATAFGTASVAVGILWLIGRVGPVAH